MLGVSCDGIYIVERFRHSAKLTVQHALELCLIQRLKFVVCPVAHSQKHVHSLLVAAEAVLVEQSGIYFMQGIEGGPHYFFFNCPVDKILRESTQITAFAQRLLAFGQSFY